MLAAVAFLDAFQKVADMATNTRGGEACGWRLGVPQGGPGGWKGRVRDGPRKVRQAQNLEFCSLMEWAGCGE